MKSMVLKHAATAAVLVAAGFMLAGCGGSPELHQPKALQQLPKAGYHMQTLWSEDIGSGPGSSVSGLQAAVEHHRVYAAGSNGRVSARHLKNGKAIWSVDTNTPLIAGPGVGNGVVVVATRNGELRALSAKNGKSLWHQQLSSEVIAAPAIAHHTLVARTLDGRVVAFDVGSGDRKWTVQRSEPKLTMRGTSSPVIKGRNVYVGMDSGKVLALKLATGEKRWAQTVALPTGRSQLARIVDIDADPVIKQNDLYAISVGNRLAAMALSGGNIRWKQKVGSSKGLVVGNQSIYTVNPDSKVLALSLNGGSKRWQNKALAYRHLSPPALYHGGVLVGDYQGYLHWLGSDNGKEIGRGHPFGQGIRAKPLVVGNKVLVLGTGGTLAAVQFVSAGGS